MKRKETKFRMRVKERERETSLLFESVKTSEIAEVMEIYKEIKNPWPM